ncbi:predicted protein [Nematostella vectensis]|uniref:G-protein coupled receptors family 1 profile domain-containing protein n=1 Tax=Nematostella vectensis TaxID=45351 RepID=A7SGB8_NEMVE|nr:predicted protein [Nematostella vectensis]|eukprot:XP_001629281.1 predicted protein [Nematostella vectensis]
MNNSTGATPEIDFLTHSQIALNVIYSILVIIGTIFNSLVLSVVCTTRRQRTANDVFLISLATADLSYIYIVVAFFFYNTYFVGPKHLIVCKTVLPLISVPYTAGIFTIVSMAIQRCHVILNPWRPKAKPRVIIVWVIGIWVAAIAIIFVPLSLLAYSGKAYCDIGWTSVLMFKAYLLTLSAIQYFIPVLIIAFAYIRMGLYLCKPRIPRDSVISRGNRCLHPREESKSESIQIAKSLGAIVVLFIVMFLPQQVSLYEYLFGTNTKWVLYYQRFREWLKSLCVCFRQGFPSRRTSPVMSSTEWTYNLRDTWWTQNLRDTGSPTICMIRDETVTTPL